MAQLKAELSRLPGEAAAADARLKAESERLTSLRDRLKHLEADRKKLEIEAESRRSQVQKYRVQLSQIKSNTEYQALLKEIARAEDDIREVEDRELVVMEEVEQTQPAVKQEQAMLQEVTEKTAALKADLQRREFVIRAELDKLTAERAALALWRAQALHSPHIDEAEPARMAGLDARLAQLEQEAADNLKAMALQTGAAGRLSLKAATSAAARHAELTAEIADLSRQNSNLVSLQLSLGHKRRLAAQCGDQLQAMIEQVNARSFKAVR